MMEILLLVAACLNLGAIAWVVVGWHKRRKSPDNNPLIPGLTIIVAARNERENLRKNLPALLSPLPNLPFEVIVVLDRCNDGSDEVVREMRGAAPEGTLRVITIDELPEGWTGKKHALRQGIEAAKYEYLAFTDADCEPEPLWREGMANAFSSGANLVLGVGPMRAKTGMLNLLQRFETWMTGILYLGMAGNGRPYMGVGRSIGYMRTLFGLANGFDSHKGRLSGDDDLLVNAVAGRAKVALLNEPGSRTYSEAPTTWKNWIRQKMRHHSAAPAYPLFTKLILAAFHGLHAIFYLSLALALLSGGDPVWVFAIWGGRSVVAGFLWASIPWPNRIDLLILSPFLDVVFLIYLILVGSAGMVFRPEWKGK